MAALFATLLGLCVTILGYFIYYFAHSERADGPFMLKLSLLAIILMTTVICISFFISVFVVTRTNRIASTAREIMETGNLAQRITVDSRWDDLSYVSSVLNAFLDRNQDLVEGVKRVSDNIAHDLRTPLTRLRNNLEALKTKGEGSTAMDADALIAEADHLLSTFNALLRIARIETAQQRNFTQVQLDDMLHDVVDLYEPVAEEKGMTISLHAENAPYVGDKNLLFQAFANLVDNAIKFGPPDSAIDILLKKEGAAVTCTVSDHGPGIPASERDKVFRRFYRGEQSRTTQGNGLGLSLVQAVVALHGGRITLGDAAPGLSAKITFI